MALQDGTTSVTRRSGLPPRRNGPTITAGYHPTPRRPRPWASKRSKETGITVPSKRRGSIRDLRHLLAIFFLLSSAAIAADESLFGYRELTAPTLAAFPQWSDLLARIDHERPTYRNCETDCDTLRPRLWRTYLSHQGAVTTPLLWEINTFINTFPKRPADERWSTPLEFLYRGGDALETAVMKYVTLRELGVEESRLSVVLGRDVLTDQPHAVLAVTLDGEHHILDSRSDTVLPHHAVAYYQPRFALNAEGRRLYLPPTNEEP